MERPAWKISAATCSRRQIDGDVVRQTRPASTARRRTASRSIPAPSSRTAIWIMSRSRRASISMRPASGLPASSARLDLEPVIDGVAQQMDQRIAEPVENRAVQLELGAAQHHLDLLAQRFGDFARGPRQRFENAQQRRRAQLEGAALQIADHALHAIERRRRARRNVAALRRAPRFAPGSRCRITSPTVRSSRSRVSVRTRTDGGGGGAAEAPGGAAAPRGGVSSAAERLGLFSSGSASPAACAASGAASARTRARARTGGGSRRVAHDREHALEALEPAEAAATARRPRGTRPARGPPACGLRARGRAS